MSDLNVIIVEDEVGAANNLKLMLGELMHGIRILTTLPSIEDTLRWLSENTHPDLAFFDIQLEDGLSFEIFKHTEISFPVIFTTAYDRYAIDAFKVNSIDYLLKPVKEKELKFSIDKYRKLNQSTISSALINKIIDAMPGHQPESMFLVQFRDKLLPVPQNDFAFFFIAEGVVYGCTQNNQTYTLDYTIEQLEVKLNNNQFFRANRQYIINRTAVKEIEFYFNGRLVLKLSPQPKDTVLVSKERASMFKGWLKGGRPA